MAVDDSPGDAMERLVDVKDTAIVGPAPVRLTDCGEPVALSVMDSVPVRVPSTVGLNVTAIVQLAPAAAVVPQLFDWAKSPVAAMDVTARDAWPEFVRVIVCAGLVVPIASAVNERLLCESVTIGEGTVPVPVSET